ncbi:hypothetical protein BSL78_16291 [Apostichopus japonicus]|uniref:Uncharacterized protein n=1 Tax=Stichopus japonicus TaxID=307972 RepID=A0A2G8KFQ7_STIJA|nr:hypothetical protein BSL78_16291 [Apostichopus japonicus]
MSGSRSTGVVVPGVVRTQRRAPGAWVRRGPGSGETPGPARLEGKAEPRFHSRSETAPGAGNQSYTIDCWVLRDWLRRARARRERGRRGRSPVRRSPNGIQNWSRSREPTRVIQFTTTTTFTTRLTTARPQNGVAGAEARPADPLTGAAAGPEAGNRRDYQCRAPRTG